jgi:enoyl-CoA hydratase
MSLVNYTAKDGVAVLELNNPPANSYTHELLRRLDDAILEARFDEGVHALVLRGAGDKFFCAGAHIDLLAKATSEYKRHFVLHGHETLVRLENTPKLVIAAINGHCTGGGLEIALACDIRIGLAGSGKLGLPESALGVLPGMGGTQRLTRVIGKGKAIELMALAENVSMDEALRMGILQQLWPAEGWWDKVLDYARKFVPPARASRAVGLIKRAAQSGAEASLGEGLALEREVVQQVFESQDAAEGLKAFLEKRKANFKGM